MKKTILIFLLAASLVTSAQDGTSVSSTNSSDKIKEYVTLVSDAINNGHVGDSHLISLESEIKCLLTEDQVMTVDINLSRPNVRQSLCHNEWPEVITISKDDLNKFGSSYQTYQKKFPSTSSSKGSASPVKTQTTR